jgi:glycosyltransferase involved in cell wall biosynthesis
LKILYLHQYFQTPLDAGGTRSYVIAKHLISLGHKVKMVYLTTDRARKDYNDDYEGIKLIKLNFNYSNKQSFFKRALVFIKFSLKTCSIVLKEDYDIIYATSTPLTIGVPALLAKLIRRKKYIFEVRDLWPELPRAMGVVNNKFLYYILKILEISCYKFSDFCIGLSPGIIEGIKKYVPSEKTVLISNYSNIDFFKPKTNFNDKKKIKLIYAGALGLANGIDNILNEAKRLLNLGYNINSFQFDFYGTGIKQQHLINRVKNENLTNCKFYDPVPKLKLKKIFHDYDMGIMSLENIKEFHYGTSPNKFFDYISSGLPVICNYDGWIKDLIEEYNIGIATNPNVKDDFSKKLISLLNNKKTIETHSINSRNLAEKEFSDKEQLKKISKVIEIFN